MLTVSDNVRYMADVMFSGDVHDIWRSSLQPGADTSFEEHIVGYLADGETQYVDIANTSPQELPPQFRDLSYRTGAMVLSMIDRTIDRGGAEIESMHIEKMALHLGSVWPAFTRHNTAGDTPEPYDVQAGQDSYAETLRQDKRIWTLDKRLVVAGLATILDTERYPYWAQAYDIDRIQSIHGVRQLGGKGLKLLEEVRQGRPVPIGSSLDDLSLATLKT